MSNETKIISLKEAADKFGATNLVAFRRTMRKLGCLVNVDSLEFVDIQKLDNCVQDMAKRPQTRSRRNGSKIGLLKDRLARYPEFIAKKEKAIAVAKEAVSQAERPYYRQRAQLNLTALEAELAKLNQARERDQAALERILDQGQLELPVATESETN